MTEDKYAPLREAVEKAKKGPWDAPYRGDGYEVKFVPAGRDIGGAGIEGDLVWDGHLVILRHTPVATFSASFSEGDKDFIILARNLVPDLLREHDEMEKMAFENGAELAKERALRVLAEAERDEMAEFLKTLRCPEDKGLTLLDYRWSQQECSACSGTLGNHKSAIDAFLRGRGK